MTHLKSAWGLVRDNRRAFIVLNAVYYGLVLIFMVVAAFNRPLQDSLINTVGEAFMTGPLSAVGSAYVNAQVFTAISLTFLVNLIIASFLYITIPSLIVPFIGILMGIYRAILWGLIFSPAHPDMQMIMIPHSITLILEGQAYVLAMFGAYLQGSAFLFPKTVGLERRGQGYREGLKRTGKLYLLIVLTLLVAAIYEVIESVIMVKFFS
jgi:hypothetical protein